MHLGDQNKIVMFGDAERMEPHLFMGLDVCVWVVKVSEVENGKKRIGGEERKSNGKQKRRRDFFGSSNRGRKFGGGMEIKTM